MKTIDRSVQAHNPHYTDVFLQEFLSELLLQCCTEELIKWGSVNKRLLSLYFDKSEQFDDYHSFDCHIDNTGAPDEWLLAKEKSLEIEENYEKLPLRSKCIWNHFYHDGHPIEQIAQEFGMTTDAVKRQLHRIIQKLKNLHDQ